MTDADDRERRIADASADYDQTYGDLVARQRDEVRAELARARSEIARLRRELDHVRAVSRRADPCLALVQGLVACAQQRGHRGDHEGTSSVISWPQDTPPQPSPSPPGLYCATVDHGDRPAAAVGTVEVSVLGHDKHVRVAYCAECARAMTNAGVFAIEPWPSWPEPPPDASWVHLAKPGRSTVDERLLAPDLSIIRDTTPPPAARGDDDGWHCARCGSPRWYVAKLGNGEWLTRCEICGEYGGKPPQAAPVERTTP